MDKDVIIEASSVSFKYPDGTNALEKVSLKIEKGKMVALLGGNGAGKSTLFLNLNGILKPSEGKILYKGAPIAYSSKFLNNLRKSIGIVFQDPDNQLFSANVYQDVSFGVVNLGLEEKEARERIEDALKRTGVDELRHKSTHSLSYGQKKRVALAGIIAMQPEVLILDEPTAGLDPEGVSEIMGLIKELQIELEIAIIIATHDIDLVPLYCDYAYVLSNGKVALQGTPEEIFKEPHKLKDVHLRIPSIGQLMEILREKDGFKFKGAPTTISSARKALKEYVETLRENSSQN